MTTIRQRILFLAAVLASFSPALRSEQPQKASRATPEDRNELGARGIGEIGLTGIAAALTEAVHHATGIRVRELPIKIEDLI